MTHSTIWSTYSPLEQRRYLNGFTLVEISVVLVIIGLVLGSILGPLSTQRENQKIKATHSLLEDINSALLGFASLNGFLPCPATLVSGGLEARVGAAGSACTQEHGYVPSATLGLTGQFEDHNLIADEWGNAVYYSLSGVNAWAYAINIRLDTPAPTYNVCSAAGCGVGTILAANVVAVVFSRGPDGLPDGVGHPLPVSPDQLENVDGDTSFVSRIPTEGALTHFDDVVVWLSPNLLALQLVKSGRLGGG